MPPPLSLILPTSNEASTIAELIARILISTGHETEVIVVDDDSHDGTGAIVTQLSSTHPNIHLIHRSGRRGLTSALQEGIDAARGRLVGWMDCDLSMPPETLPTLIHTATHEADIAVGSRYVPGGADAREERLAVELSKIICTLCRCLLHRHIYDYTSGFIVAQRKVLEHIHLRGSHGEYCIDFLHRATLGGFRIQEVPYQLVSRKRGVSKTATHALGFAITGRRYLTTLFHSWWSSRCP